MVHLLLCYTRVGPPLARKYKYKATQCQADGWRVHTEDITALTSGRYKGTACHYSIGQTNNTISTKCESSQPGDPPIYLWLRCERTAFGADERSKEASEKL